MIYKFDLKGNLVGEYKTAAAAARATKIRPSGIRDCLNNKAKSAGRFLWSKNNKAPYWPQVYQFNLEGELLATHVSVTAASEHLGVHRQGISNCLCGRARTAYGYRWSYKSTVPKWRKIGKFSLAGELLQTFNTLKETGYGSGVSRCLKGEAKTAHGFKWHYIREEK